jgi:hypothetical protein
MSSTFGLTGAATFGWNTSGLNTDCEIMVGGLTCPELARVQTLSVYMASHGAGVSTRLCMWDSSGNLLAQSGAFTPAVGTGAPGGQFLQTQTIPDTVLQSGQQVFIGFWRAPAGAAEWGVANAGSFNIACRTGLCAAGPGNIGAPALCAGPYLCGNPQAYATYLPILTWVGRGGIWVREQTQIGRSGAWSGQAVPVFVGRAGSWKQIG